MAGIVTFSVEIELGWGVGRYGMMDKLSDGRESETEALETVLDACDEHGFEFTFDVVEHLFFDSCDGTHEGDYPDGWFDVDPATSVERDPHFYAPDLIRGIRGADVDHEICSHTFSHVECGTVGEDTLRSEFDHSNRTRATFGFDENESFVPPRHSMPPTDLLSEFADVVRVPHYEHPEFHRPSRPEKLKELLFGSHPAIEPVLEDGVLKTYSPEYITIGAPTLPRGQRPSHRVFRHLPVSLRQTLHRRTLKEGVRDAIANDSFVHFWCHLYDISNEPQLDTLLPFLEWLGEKTDDGAVRVEPMRNLKRYVEDGESDDGETRSADPNVKQYG